MIRISFPELLPNCSCAGRGLVCQKLDPAQRIPLSDWSTQGGITMHTSSYSVPTSSTTVQPLARHPRSCRPKAQARQRGLSPWSPKHPCSSRSSAHPCQVCKFQHSGPRLSLLASVSRKLALELDRRFLRFVAH